MVLLAADIGNAHTVLGLLQPAVEGAELFVRCEMPAHGHGMNVEPKAQEEGSGRYLVDGMLLHMTGEWELGVDVVIDGRAESVSFPLTLALK